MILVVRSADIFLQLLKQRYFLHILSKTYYNITILKVFLVFKNKEQSFISKYYESYKKHRETYMILVVRSANIFLDLLKQIYIYLILNTSDYYIAILNAHLLFKNTSEESII